MKCFTYRSKQIQRSLSRETNMEKDNGILTANKYQKSQDTFLNGKLTPNLRAIMWPKTTLDGEWHAQVLPTESGKYGLHGDRFEFNASMTFVHSNGFFAVAPNKETMVEYLTRINT